MLAMLPVTATAQETSPEPTLDVSLTPAATPTPAAGPEGTWRVVAFDAWGQGLAEPRPQSRLTVSLLDDAQLQGETGCGRFNGGWSVEGDGLFLGLAPSGFIGCAEQDAEEALGLSTAFNAVATWQPADAGMIELLDTAGTTRVTLAPFTLGDPVGTWDVQRYRRPNGRLVEPLPGSPMALGLTADGRVEGNTGCRLLQWDLHLRGWGHLHRAGRGAGKAL